MKLLPVVAIISAGRLILQPLPQPFRQSSSSKVPGVEQALLAKIDVPHVDHVLRRRLADAAGDDDRVRLEDDAVVHDLVKRYRDQVVVFDYGALVDRVPVNG